MAEKPTLYAYGIVTGREDFNQLSKIEVQSGRGDERPDVSLSFMAGKESSRWLEVGMEVSIRIRTKRAAKSLDA